MERVREQPKITFESFHVRKLLLDSRALAQENGIAELDHSVKPIVYFFHNDDTHYGIKFDVRVFNTVNSEIFISCDFVTVFSSTQILDEDFKNSHFVRLNSPAIAFPYLRSFLTTLTVNAGYEPYILPTLNFTPLDEDDRPIPSLDAHPTDDKA